jgi:hypothetical protein
VIRTEKGEKGEKGNAAALPLPPMLWRIIAAQPEIAGPPVRVRLRRVSD